MITTKITIENYLAEYLIGKYGTPDSKVVRLPSDLDLYHFVYDLLQKRPAGCLWIAEIWSLCCRSAERHTFRVANLWLPIII